VLELAEYWTGRDSDMANLKLHGDVSRLRAFGGELGPSCLHKIHVAILCGFWDWTANITDSSNLDMFVCLP
jgi:hypothetical protein